MSTKKPAVPETTEKKPAVPETTEKKPAAKKVAAKLSAIAAAATEINTKLTPDPLLDLATGDKQITKDLVELIPSIQPDDDLSDATKKVLTDLGWGKKAEKKIEKPSATKAAVKGEKAPKIKKAGGGSKYAPDAKITLLVKENPKRSGSASAKRFSLYKTGMTVAKALEAGVTGMDIVYDTAKGFIKVG